MTHLPVALAFSCALLSVQANAGLIAHYTFDSGLDDGVPGTTYDLTASGGDPDLSLGAYFSDGNPSNFLSVTGPGGMPDWTLSMWAYTGMPAQGEFEALFSNMQDPNERYSWQIDSHNGSYRLLSRENDNAAINIGTSSANRWQHIVVQKQAGNTANIYFDGKFVQSTGFNPGGLQNFRVGVNRNDNRSFEGYIDNIKIWDDSLQDAKAISTLYREGPGANSVPVPAPIFLLGGGLLAISLKRKRRLTAA